MVITDPTRYNMTVQPYYLSAKMHCKEINHEMHKKILFTNNEGVSKRADDLTVKEMNKEDKTE
jgi:hypothetical protein